MTKFVNLTPHAVNYKDPVTGQSLKFLPSGQVARVEIHENHFDVPSIGLKVKRKTYGSVTGLPEPGDGIIYIVSSLVLQRLPARTDIIAPETVRTARRDFSGRVDYVTCFVCN